MMFELNVQHQNIHHFVLNICHNLLTQYSEVEKERENEKSAKLSTYIQIHCITLKYKEELRWVIVQQINQ